MRYRLELEDITSDDEALKYLKHQLIDEKRDISLLFAAKDRRINHATVLGAWLSERFHTDFAMHDQVNG